MGDRMVHGVVIRYANFSESSRMLTLFTLEEGLVSAAARGARRLKSPLRTAAEVFSFAAFDLHPGRSGGLTVTSASLVDSFYGLREDLDYLACATEMTELVLALAPEGDPLPALFSLFVRSLGSLCHDGEEPFKVGMHFQARAMALAGYAPQLKRCALCGGALGDRPGFSPSDGGAVCTGCARQAGLEAVPPGVMKTLAHVADFDVARLHVLAIPPRQREAASALWARYMDYHLNRHFAAPEFAKRLARFKIQPPGKK